MHKTLIALAATTLATAHGPLVTLPYSLETNDISAMVVQHHEGAYWTQKCIDQLWRGAPCR